MMIVVHEAATDPVDGSRKKGDEFVLNTDAIVSMKWIKDGKFTILTTRRDTFSLFEKPDEVLTLMGITLP